MSDDEDDYLSMSFAEPAKSGRSAKESSLQRTARLKREAAERGRPLSKAEQAAKAEATLQTGLTTKLDASNNVGAKLMAKMGFKGGSLGAAGNEGRQNPVEVMMKEDRGGIGMDSEKKRKIREAGEAEQAAEKKVKLTEAEFRERARQEREDKRAEGQWWAAMRILEGLEETETSKQPLSCVNILYRPLVQDRRKRDQDRRDRKTLYDGLTTKHDTDLDADDRIAMNHEIDDDDETEDAELEEYLEQTSSERLEKVLSYLREKYNYCFWCKYRYPDSSMDGCPGLSEDEHG